MLQSACSVDWTGVLSLIIFFNNKIVNFIAVTGLVCSAILKKLSKKANNVKEQILSIEFEEHSKYTILLSIFVKYQMSLT